MTSKAPSAGFDFSCLLTATAEEVINSFTAKVQANKTYMFKHRVFEEEHMGSKVTIDLCLAFFPFKTFLKVQPEILSHYST